MSDALSNGVPGVSDAEFRGRLGAVQEQMGREGLDLLFIFSNQVDPANVRYFTNYWPNFEQTALLVPKRGEPTLFVGMECYSYAQVVSKVKDIRMVPDISIPEEEYVTTAVTTFREVFREVGGSVRPKRVGVVGSYILPYGVYDQLREVFAEQEIVKADRMLTDLRAIKSPAEIRLIRQAFAVCDIAAAEAECNVVAGKSEQEVGAIIEAAILRNGAEDHVIPWSPMVPSGPRNTQFMLNRNTLRKFEEGDLVSLCVGSCVEGYCGSICIPQVVGPAPAMMQEAFDAAAAAMAAIEAGMGPGMTGAEVDATGRAVLRQRGFEQYSPYGMCHTIGMLECEPPFFGMTSEAVLQPGMTLCMDVSLFGFEWGGFRWEDGVVITEDGMSRLSRHMEKYF